MVLQPVALTMDTMALAARLSTRILTSSSIMPGERGFLALTLKRNQADTDYSSDSTQEPLRVKNWQMPFTDGAIPSLITLVALVEAVRV